MSTSEVMAFDEALRQLADLPCSISNPMLYALSAPTRAEAARFQQIWPALPVTRRHEVIAALVENAEANFELDFDALFRITVEDEDAQVRAASIEGLWENEELWLIAPLLRMLQQDAAADVRAVAASSLGRFVLLGELEELDQSHLSAIQEALYEVINTQDEPVEVRRRAIEAIAYSTEEGVHDLLTAAYEDADEEMRISAVFAMGRSADPEFAEPIQFELGSSNPAMRYEAARACGELELDEAVPALIRLIADSDREVQSAAVASLGQIGGKRAREALERCVSEGDEVLQLAAEDALAELQLGRQPLDLLAYDPSCDDEAGEDDLDLDE